MVEANVKIMDGLKKYIREVLDTPALRELYISVPNAFTRERDLTFERTFGLIINQPKRSLSVELREFFASIPDKVSCPSKSAFCQQRSKISPLLFQSCNSQLVKLFYDTYGTQVQRWRGHLIHAVDGSTAYLMNKSAVITHFGTQENQHVSVPMARIMQLHDVLNDITLWGDIYPIKDSEQKIMMENVNKLSENSITMFDRGYPGFSLIYQLQNNDDKERLFVMRAKERFNKEVKAFVASSKKDIITYFSVNDNARKTLGEYGYQVSAGQRVKVRLVKVPLSGGQTEILITNLYDRQLYSMEDLSYLYFLRWGIETCYGKEKSQQQLEQFSGHRVICIQQDYHATLLVSNIQSLIEKQSVEYVNAVSKRRKYRYKINRNVSWAALKNTIFLLFFQNNATRLLVYLQDVFERNLEPVRPGRSYKRTTKAKRLNGKYQTFTSKSEAKRS